ncbi:acetylxylan esterase precursor [Phyllosticta capitalensis]
MHLHALLPLLALPLPTLSSPAASPPRLIVRQIKCAPIHIIAARESLQGPGPGSIGSLAQLIQDANPGTTLESVDYPATLDNYDSSSREGTKKTTESLTSYVKACPCAQIVMLGYSQGAHVIGDTLCGGGEYLGIPKSPPVDKAVSDRVFAIVFMGDPRHVPGQPFDQGTADQPGTFPRPPDISCEPFQRRLVSYCDRNDTYCASGQDIVTHLTYTDRYNQKGLDFVNSKLVKVGGGKQGEL